jgi:hypothetical protein
LRPAWTAEQIPGQLGLHSETLSQKKKKKPKTVSIEGLCFPANIFQRTNENIIFMVKEATMTVV